MRRGLVKSKFNAPLALTKNSSSLSFWLFTAIPNPVRAITSRVKAHATLKGKNILISLQFLRSYIHWERDKMTAILYTALSVKNVLS